jgi:hypothetical protein
MTRSSLITVLTQLGVPRASYDFDVKTPDIDLLGQLEGKWSHYFIEKGNLSVIKQFSSEEELYDYYLADAYKQQEQKQKTQSMTDADVDDIFAKLEQAHIEKASDQDSHSDGLTYRNSLAVLNDFCAKFQLDFWKDQIEKAISEWDSVSGTKSFKKSCEKSDFLNSKSKSMPILPIKEKILEMYLYWLKKGCSSYMSCGNFEFPEYNRDIIWGYYCDNCRNCQTNDKYLYQYVIIRTLEVVFRENLPHQENLGACGIENIIQSDHFFKTEKLIRQLLQDFAVLPEHRDLKKCFLCKRKTQLASWVMKKAPGGYYLGADQAY